MNKIKIYIVFTLFTFAFSGFLYAADLGPSLEISDKDCDIASSALTNLMGDLKENALSAAEKAVYEKALKQNAVSYKGDPEKCIMVSQDFVRVLSIDALALYNDKRHSSIFKRLLFYTSDLQSGDIRQHAAAALAEIKAFGTYPDILKSSRDPQTFMVGYKKDNTDVLAKLTMKERIDMERRNLRLDPYSYPITKALKTLVKSRFLGITRSAIESENDLRKENKSAWNDQIRSDMLRVAASIDKSKEIIELIEQHSYLPMLDRLRAYAHIKNNLIIEPVSQIIRESAKLKSVFIPMEMKLAFYMLSKLKTKQAKREITELSLSEDPAVSFMAHVFMAKYGRKASLDEVKKRISEASDRLKIEGMKVLAQRKDRNSVPILKSIISTGDLKMKVSGIWCLARLGVIDPKYNAEKLIKKIKPKDEAGLELDLKGTLQEAIKFIEKVKPAY